MSQRLSLEKKGRGYSSWEGADAGKAISSSRFPVHDSPRKDQQRSWGWWVSVLPQSNPARSRESGRRAAHFSNIRPESLPRTDILYPRSLGACAGLWLRPHGGLTGGKDVCNKDRAFSVEMKCLCSKHAVPLGPGLHPELVPLAPPPPSRHRWCRVTPTSAAPTSAPQTTCLPLSLKDPCDVRPSR